MKLAILRWTVLSTAYVFMGGALDANAATKARPGGKPTSSLCKASETVVYDCDLVRKIASVCRTDKQVIFRFGSPGKTEIEIASNGRDGRVHKDYVVGGGRGGFSRGVRFSQDGIEFIMYVGMAGSLTGNFGKMWSGLDIEKKHVILANSECKVTKRVDPILPDFVPEETDPDYSGWH